MTSKVQEQHRRFYDALKRITEYMPPEKLRRQAEKLYGLPPEEAVEYAYENVLNEAKEALRGIRKPTIEAVGLESSPPSPTTDRSRSNGNA